MADRLRTTALSLVWTLAGCPRSAGSPSAKSPPSAPGPSAEAKADERLLPITYVPQLAPRDVDEWLFEPGGARVGSAGHGSCVIWDVETGQTLGVFEDGEHGDSPCDDWEPVVGLEDMACSDVSADERLELDTSHGVAILDAQSGRKLRELPCPDCVDVDAVCWSPQGHQVALLWEGAARIEVWDADTATRLQAESIPIDGDLEEIALVWTAGGPTVAWRALGYPVECRQDDYSLECQWDETLQFEVRRSPERSLLVLSHTGPETTWLGDEGSIDDLVFDQEGHWAIWTRSYSVPLKGVYSQTHVDSLSGKRSALGWTDVEEYYQYANGDPIVTREGQWRSDGLIHWAVTSSSAPANGWPDSIDWDTLVTSPPLGAHAGVVVEGLDYNDSVQVELFGLVDTSLQFVGERCGETCTQLGPAPPPDCVVVDLASTHGSELFDCQGTAFLRSVGGLHKLPIDAEAMKWWWSRGGMLAVHEGGDLIVLDARTGTAHKPRTHVEQVFDAKLGPELDQLVVVDARGTALLDLRTNATRLSLAGIRARQAALSPTGERLALLIGDELGIFDVASGELVARGPAKGEELAFRQDGAVIYVGTKLPQFSFDATTALALDDPTQAEILAEIADAVAGSGELDPSWRWVMNDAQDSLTRTLDGRDLIIHGSACQLPDTGQFSGWSLSGGAFRVGTDPFTIPTFSAQDLAKWLERPKLFEEFFTGQAIPAPQMEARELAQLEAKAKN